MPRMLQNLLPLICLTSWAYGQTNYCDPSLCGTSTHIACNNNGAWASTCPTSPSPTAKNFGASDQQLILKMHNYRRNRLASGLLTKYKAAKRMATMRWDAELATLAALNVKQCKMNHDACHNTKKFKASGQNLAIYGYSGPQSGKTVRELIIASINMWWNEKKDANMAVINKYPSSWSGPQIGHFTAMAQEKNTHCGCAAAFYYENGMNWFLMACNYATTNWVGEPVYQRGVKASGCKKGTNVNYPGLCKVSEVYNV
ncbi:antigen 5 like allergen Cul n 1 [Drosophila ananassae]|uniref:antigen 5 like allergen Cul n 1 n=1 Tax=Drosophila ananassae TaxID=7217 RepID=UPI000177EE99|nr:antigen 5 like allergen Cul n 1 [Drosophila ananassae]